VEPFKPSRQCAECLMGLARQAAVQARGDDSSFLLQTEAVAREILAEAEQKGLTSPDVGNRILREVRIRSGVSDPYVEFKAREMAQARNVISQMKGSLSDDLRSCVKLAALGNSIDFFTDPEQTLSEIPNQIQKSAFFFHDDIDRLEGFLSAGPGLVLFLTDNAGEIYFDQPLYEYIQKRVGRTVLVVKGGPSLNDLTRAELRVDGLEERFSEVADTGTDGVGIDWEGVSKGFLDLVDQADLILAKGMANFESMYPRDLPCPVLFLFKVKCQPMQDYLEAPGESYWALWREAKSLDS
jgi:damage-control phosphatase, subfamily I